MSDIIFTDPNIPDTETFEVNGHSITAPVFTADNIRGVIESVRANSDKYFSSGNASLSIFAESFALWNNIEYDLRMKALPILSDITQFSQQNISCFGLNPLKLIDFAKDRFPDIPQRLSRLAETGQYQRFSGWGKGYIKGYGVPKVKNYEHQGTILQILAGNVVGPTWLSAFLGAVSRSSQLIKLPSHDLTSFMFYVETLNELDPDFRRTMACGYFSGTDDVNELLFRESDVVVAMGSDETITAIEKRLSKVNPETRLLPHGYKMGFQVISKEYATLETAGLAAWGIAAYDGNGCFSPSNIYIEYGGQLNPSQFSDALANSLKYIASLVPSKKTIAAADKVTNYRNAQMKRMLLGENISIIKSLNTDYTIILDSSNPLIEPTCQERTVIVKPVNDIRNVPEYVKHMARNLQTAGLAVPTNKLLEISEKLGDIGVTNIKILGMEHTIDIIEPHDGIFDAVQMHTSDGLRWVSIGFNDTDKEIESALKIVGDSIRELYGQGDS